MARTAACMRAYGCSNTHARTHTFMYALIIHMLQPNAVHAHIHINTNTHSSDITVLPLQRLIDGYTLSEATLLSVLRDAKCVSLNLSTCM